MLHASRVEVVIGVMGVTQRETPWLRSFYIYTFKLEVTFFSIRGSTFHLE